jgi:hypothetical protein
MLLHKTVNSQTPFWLQGEAYDFLTDAYLQPALRPLTDVHTHPVPAPGYQPLRSPSHSVASESRLQRPYPYRESFHEIVEAAEIVTKETSFLSPTLTSASPRHSPSRSTSRDRRSTSGGLSPTRSPSMQREERDDDAISEEWAGHEAL